jgi:hypothetical protein
MLKPHLRPQALNASTRQPLDQPPVPLTQSLSLLLAPSAALWPC